MTQETQTELTWGELEGKYLRGVMNRTGPDAYNDDVVLFFDDYAIVVTSINKDYSWYDNWKIVERLPESEWPDRDDNYKIVGEEIREVWTDGYDTNSPYIEADMDKWIAAVGKGAWNAKEGVQYTMLELRCGMKVIEFGTVYWDCHYPDAVWEVIE